MFFLKKINFKHFELFNFQTQNIIESEKIKIIEENFRKFLGSIPNGINLFNVLPRNIYYYPLIADCYNKIFYARSKKPENCPGPSRCDLPTIPGLNCVIAKRRFTHKSINSLLEIHSYYQAGKFIINKDGCNM